ncbi:MAG: OsmC family protein [Anaerolineaceae bacterium]|nr:MAG: OsmC family protein [Anaerolineaceae bacterium]
MKKLSIHFLLSTSIFLSLLVLSACSSAVESPPQSEQTAQESTPEAVEVPELATARVSAMLSEPGEAVVTGHNDLQYAVFEESGEGGLTEIGTLLAAQVTCGVFVAEKAAQELDMPLTGVTGTAAFDADTQQVEVFLDLPGADWEQVLDLANHFRQRCPIYTTLSEANSVDFTPGEQFAGESGDPAVVAAELFRFGGANVTANGTTFVMDSVPPLDGPNEELNPLDMMLGGLAACSAFTYGQAAPEAGVAITIEGDFDPSGVRVLDGPNPRIQNIRVLLQADQYDEQVAKQVEAEIKDQCHLYQMLEGTVHMSVSAEQG